MQLHFPADCQSFKQHNIWAFTPFFLQTWTTAEQMVQLVVEVKGSAD